MVYDTRKVTDNITMDKILNLTSEQIIYEYYLGRPIKINKPISSPFRKDKNPSWSIFRGRKGDLINIDFATGETGNVISFVKQLLGLNYGQALNTIWKDIIQNDKVIKRPNKKEIPNCTTTRIGIKRKNFTKTDDDYWKQYNISRDTLKHFDVTPISKFWVNEIESILSYDKDNPMYAYKVFGKFKLYRPHSLTKKDKWRSNCGIYDIQGLAQLPDKGELLIITKSLKDIMVLYEYGYTAVAPQSEQASIPTSLMENLKGRFDKIIIFFDYDNGGLTGAMKLSEKHNVEYTFIDKFYLDIYGIKDISDFTKEMSDNKTKQLLKQLFT